jgi:hypothetical protein
VTSYEPRVARFASIDSAREFSNPYAYVGWRPTHFVDPSGMLLDVPPTFTPAFDQPKGPVGSIQYSLKGALADGTRNGQMFTYEGQKIGSGLSSFGSARGFGAMLTGVLLDVVGLLTAAFPFANVAQAAALGTVGGVVGGLVGLAKHGSLAGAAQGAARLGAIGFRAGAVDTHLFAVGQIAGVPSSIYAWGAKVADAVGEGNIGQAAEAFVTGAFLTLVPKYGYYGGGLWGIEQFGAGAPVLNWVDAARFSHDLRLDHLGWAGAVFNPASRGLPPGILGAAYAGFGIPFFAAGGLVQAALR